MQSQFAADDAEYGFSIREGEPQIACWASGEIKPSTEGFIFSGNYDNIKKRYAYSISIPWARLNPFSLNIPGLNQLGICILVNDYTNGVRACAESQPALNLQKDPSLFDTLIIKSHEPKNTESKPVKTGNVKIKLDMPKEINSENLIDYSLKNQGNRYGVLELALYRQQAIDEQPTRSFSVVKEKEQKGSLFFRCPWNGDYLLLLKFWDLDNNTYETIFEKVINRKDEYFVFDSPEDSILSKYISEDSIKLYKNRLPIPDSIDKNSFDYHLYTAGWEKMLERTVINLLNTSVMFNDSAPITHLPPFVLMQTDHTLNCIDVRIPWYQPEDAIAETRGLQGEHEGAAILIGNYDNFDITLKIDCRQPQYENHALPITLYQALEIRGIQNISVPDVLSPISSNLVIIPKKSIVQLYIDFDLSTPAGIYYGDLRIALLGGEQGFYHFPIKAEILPISLPEPMPVNVCVWPIYKNSLYDETGEQILKDLKEHHINVHILPGKLIKSETGELSPNPEWNWLISRAREPNWQLLIDTYSGLSANPKNCYESSADKELIEKELRFIVNYLENIEGLARSEYAFYAVDEPGWEGPKVQLLRNFCKVVKNISPDLRVYTDPFEGFDENHYKEFSNLVDIFCPNTGMFLHKAVGREGLKYKHLKSKQFGYKFETSSIIENKDWITQGFALNVDVFNSLMKQGRSIWCYDCELNAKTLPVLGYYRHRGWIAWRFGLNGFGFFAYNRNTSARVMWFGKNTTSFEYDMAYPGMPGIIPSRRWEACRDAAEDYALCWQLNQISKDNIDKQIKKDIQKVLSEDVYRIISSDINHGQILYKTRNTMLNFLQSALDSKKRHQENE